MLDTCFIQFELDYSGTKNLPIGDFAAGKHIDTGGCTCWTIACCPRGKRSNGEHISVMVSTNSRNVVNTAVHIFVMGRDGETTSFVHTKSSGKITAGTDNTTSIWWHRFMRRSEIESGGYLVDGSVTFVCGIIDLNTNRIPVPPSDLSLHLAHLVHPADFDSDDVSFSVGGKTFRAHRAILAARSPVFKAQLFGSLADDAKTDSSSSSSKITLNDVQPEAFRILLWFLYTDTLPTDTYLNERVESSSWGTVTDLLQHLLEAGDMYQMDRLKLMCAQRLWDCVSPENVAAMLVCAEKHRCPELKKRCMDFFVVDKNFKKAVLTEGYSRLIQGFPSVIEEIRARLVLDP